MDRGCYTVNSVNLILRVCDLEVVMFNKKKFTYKEIVKRGRTVAVLRKPKRKEKK